MRDLVGLLEKAELAIGSVSQLADESKTARLAAAAALLRRRLDYPDDVLLVALAGGTGSGKSSLLNALADHEVAAPGGIRPTTDRPLAVASRTTLERMAGYLSDLGIAEAAPADLPAWLCLVDLPDTDSVELDHRLQVESLVPRVDLVVWVVDPEKYRDASLHHRFLRPLSRHSSRFLFAFNQIDRVAPEARASLVDDFKQALAANGIDDPKIVATSAVPPSGPPLGVDAVLAALAARRGSGVYTKTLADLEDAVTDLLETTGRSGIDFEDGAGEAVERAAELLAESRGVDAADVLIELLEGVADAVGGATGDRVRSIAAEVPRQIQVIVEEVPSSAMEAIEQRILARVRDELRGRASAMALVTDLSLSVATVRSRLGV